MILHAAEVWVSLAVCFALGGLLGSILQRAIALTALGKPQATLIRGIDRVVRWLDRRLLPWRGTVPAVLPQTVPVPPPDFGHGLDAATEPDVGEAAAACLTAGAHGITVHPRPDQRHIRPGDVHAIKALLGARAEFNIEGNVFAPARGALRRSTIG